MEELFSKLPFNSYKDLFNAIKSNKATIKFMRSDCSQIAGVKHPYFSVLGMYIGFLITMIFLIYFSIKFNNYWLLLLIPINFILSSLIVYIPKLKTIAWIVLFVDLLILKLPNFVLITCLDIICICFFYNVWWNKIYKYAIEELKYNQEAFLWSWNRCGLTIEDCYGNNYNKLTIFQHEEIIFSDDKYIELSNIIIKQLNATDIDDALIKSYEFYQAQGIDVSRINLEDDNKYGTLANLVMLALGVDNIDEAIAKTNEFYQEYMKSEEN